MSLAQDTAGGSAARESPRILIDGLFFQLARTGIGRMWQSYLERWAKTDFAEHLVILDRNGSAPRVPGLAYHPVPAFDPSDLGAQSLLIEKWCQELRADLYVSTFYSSPVRTRSLAMVYDMIYEIESGNTRTHWDQGEKALGLFHARHLAAISRHTADDLRRFYPFIAPDDISIVPCGVDALFAPAPASALRAAREKFGLRRPYFLLVGTRQGFNNYKNAIFLIRTLAGSSLAAEVEVVCVGGESAPGPLADFKNVTLRLLSHVGEDDLVALYSGAEALVYPSRYEGFGLPVLEAMACGCPVVTCANASIPEVAGEAAIFVGNDADAELDAALRQVREPSCREELKRKGRERARLFSWEKSATEMASVLLKAAALPGLSPREAEVWALFREKESEDARVKKLLPRRRIVFPLGPWHLLFGLARSKP